MHFDTAVGVRSPESDWVSFFIRALWDLPLLLVVCAWITLYLRRRKSPPAFAALISLGCTTAPAVVAVGGLIYYTLSPAVTGRILFPSRFEPNFRQSFQIALGFRPGQVQKLTKCGIGYMRV